MELEEFRRAGYALVDRIVAYRQQLNQRQLPVQSLAMPGSIAQQLPSVAPETPEAFATILSDLDRIVIPGLTHWQHPGFFGYFPSGGGLPSALADLLSTGFGVVGLNWQSSPALTEVETVMMSWMRQLLGLSDRWSGVIQDTASTATLVALLCARERSTDYSAARGGMQGESVPLVVYASSEAHSSAVKAVSLAGFGREHLHVVDIDQDFAMRPDALAAAIQADRGRGMKPCAVIATLGTTATTAIDPIAAIARIAAREGLWLHVDAALGGAAMLIPERRALWQGVEQADSVVINPHKWMSVALDCSLYFVRDPQHLVRVMSTDPSYLRTAVDAEVVNYRDWGIPLGRRFRALKLWLTLRTEGAQALRRRIERDCASAQWLAGQVDATAGWQRIAPVPLQTVCVVHQPEGLQGVALDAHTREWCRLVNASGEAYITAAQARGRWMVRVAVGAEAAERADVERLWRLMQTCAARALLK